MAAVPVASERSGEKKKEEEVEKTKGRRGKPRERVRYTRVMYMHNILKMGHLEKMQGN